MKVEILDTFQLQDQSWTTPAVTVNDPKLVITADRSGRVYAFMAGVAEPLWAVSLGKIITASPTLADINNDGVEEILIGVQDTGMLHALDLAGNVIWTVKCGSSIRSTAAVADVDNDGLMEVIVSAYGNWMCCLAGLDGSVKWKKYLGKHEFSGAKGVVSSPLIADVDMDGELEVVTGTRFKMGFCLNGKTGQFKWVVPFLYDPDSTPSFAVINGNPLVFIGGGEHTSGVGDNAMYALNGYNGSVFWRTPIHGGLDSCAVISDINKDGKPEVVITSLADASCWAFDAFTGGIIWQYKFPKADSCLHTDDNVCIPIKTKKYFTENAVCRSYTTPMVIDINADGKKEVVVGSCNGIWSVLDGESGAAIAEVQTNGNVRPSPLTADINRDGKLELIIGSGDQVLIYKSEATGEPWRMFNGEPRHTGDLADYTHVEKSIDPDKKAQTMVQLKYLWYWLVKDAGRFVMFHLDRRVFKHLGIKFHKYYY